MNGSNPEWDLPVEERTDPITKAILKLLRVNQMSVPDNATPEDMAEALDKLAVPPIAEVLVGKLDASGASVRAIIERPGKPRVEIRARYVSQ